MKIIVTSKETKKQAVDAVMAIMGSECPVQVEIKPYKKDKTAEQRGWFHKLCGLISGETGYTQGEVKELIKKHIIGTKVVCIGSVAREVTESSEKLNREEYSSLIDGAYQIGAMAGIQLPNPEPTILEIVTSEFPNAREEI